MHLHLSFEFLPIFTFQTESVRDWFQIGSGLAIAKTIASLGLHSPLPYDEAVFQQPGGYDPLSEVAVLRYKNETLV